MIDWFIDWFDWWMDGWIGILISFTCFLIDSGILVSFTCFLIDWLIDWYTCFFYLFLYPPLPINFYHSSNTTLYIAYMHCTSRVLFSCRPNLMLSRAKTLATIPINECLTQEDILREYLTTPRAARLQSTDPELGFRSDGKHGKW